MGSKSDLLPHKHLRNQSCDAKSILLVANLILSLIAIAAAAAAVIVAVYPMTKESISSEFHEIEDGTDSFVSELSWSISHHNSLGCLEELL